MRAGRPIDKAILVAGLISDRIGLVLLYIVFGPLVRDVGLTELQFGVLIASANVTLALASPYWGARSQAFGRRPVFVIGLSGYALGFVLLAIALEAGLAGRLDPGPLFLLLLAVRLGYGLVAAATQPAATAYISDITHAEQRTQGMALIGVAAGIGTLCGPVLGATLTAAGAVLPLYVAAGLAGACAASAALALREPVRSVRPLAGAATLKPLDPRLLPYLAGWCVIVLVLTGVQTVTVFYLDDRFGLAGRIALAQATGAALLCMGAAMLFTQAVVLQRWRVRPATLLGAGFLVFAGGLAVLLLAGQPWMFYGAYGLLGLGFSALSAGLNAAGTLAVGPDEQGAAAGLLAAAPVLGMVVGPVLATSLYTLDGRAPMLSGAALCACMGAYFLRRQATGNKL